MFLEEIDTLTKDVILIETQLNLHQLQLIF